MSGGEPVAEERTMEFRDEEIFEKLPGQEVRVGNIGKAIGALWDQGPLESGEAPSEFRASQMNLVIHFGRATTAAEAREKFAVALRFSQRYPCRIIALCPDPRTPEEFMLRAKVYGQCYVGKSRREMACCEAIILAYPKESKDFLENQVSILLEGDLPVYYWIHKFTSAAKVPDYFGFLSQCKRVIYDSGIENRDFEKLPWPKGTQVRDMVYARLLPVRQMIGQFMSSFTPEAIVDSLEGARLRAPESHAALVRVLGEWIEKRLDGCRAAVEGEAKLPEIEYVLQNEQDSDGKMCFCLHYGNDQHLRWLADLENQKATIEAKFDGVERELPMPLEFLSPAKELGEAFFF
ncbi:MAG: glucose-6-phosphate dehydrogenase assembly protein OpcA [Opitutales bacterium]|nr:glucose-6-phosphate dehydrogenase assembly protein OpcA [Opitutales bacterium]